VDARRHRLRLAAALRGPHQQRAPRLRWRLRQKHEPVEVLLPVGDAERKPALQKELRVHVVARLERNDVLRKRELSKIVARPVHVVKGNTNANNAHLIRISRT
jgi:hypothetical protein